MNELLKCKKCLGMYPERHCLRIVDSIHCLPCAIDGTSPDSPFHDELVTEWERVRPIERNEIVPIYHVVMRPIDDEGEWHRSGEYELELHKAVRLVSQRVIEYLNAYQTSLEIEIITKAQARSGKWGHLKV